MLDVGCSAFDGFPPQKRVTYWLYVIGPDGGDLLRYEKLFDQPQAPIPGVFAIDGVPCSTYLCADRWLRGVQEIPIQQGARVSFELSCNTANEWVAPFAWYWNVPQALRNNVWVVFANTGNTVAGVADSGVPGDLRHGHSAVIAPDGRLVAAARDDVAKIVFADIDVGEAMRAEALARAAHPVLRGFWDAGVRLHRGEAVEAPALAPIKFSPTPITLAVSPVTGDATAMAAKVREARAKGADLITFPARAIAESALPSVQAAARENQITVVFGAEHRDTSGLHNSAFVIGPDGALLTRYDQLSATAPFAPGLNPAAMRFRAKDVRAVVTIEHDGLWTELSELAAVAGAHPSAPRPRPCRRPERAAAPPSVVGESRVVSHLQRDGECVGGDDLGRPQRLGRTAWRSATKSDWMSKERSPASITCSSIC